MNGTARNIPAAEPLHRGLRSEQQRLLQGCLRNREERFNWLTMTPAQQQEVMRLCRDRKRRVEAARRKAQEGALNEPQAQPGWDF